MSVKELSDNIDVDLSTLHIMDEEAEEIDMETGRKYSNNQLVLFIMCVKSFCFIVQKPLIM